MWTVVLSVLFVSVVVWREWHYRTVLRIRLARPSREKDLAEDFQKAQDTIHKAHCKLVDAEQLRLKLLRSVDEMCAELIRVLEQNRDKFRSKYPCVPKTDVFDERLRDYNTTHWSLLFDESTLPEGQCNWVNGPPRRKEGGQ